MAYVPFVPSVQKKHDWKIDQELFKRVADTYITNLRQQKEHCEKIMNKPQQFLPFKEYFENIWIQETFCQLLFFACFL